MANIQARRDKSGKLISYSVRVHRGIGADGKPLKPYTATFKVSPTWTEKSARKKAEAFAATFEKECREGVTSDSRMKFEEYCEYVLELKERRGDKHSTIVDYRSMTPRIYPAIGHIKLRELRPDHLNVFYSQLAQRGSNRRTGGTLSNCTIRRYHRFISIVLSQAVKEGLIPMNVAARAEPPKVEKHEPNYLQPTTIPLMLDALEREPLKWRMLVHLMLVTGARRGEILGLKWENVDFDNSRIYICRSISYTPDRGVYESTPENRKQQALFNGVDIVSTAKRLGHSQVSTTSDIYAHVIEQADKKNADILGDILLKKA